MSGSETWEYDPAALSLARGTHVSRLTRKAGDVLACLMRSRGQVLSHDDLLREVWPDLHVTPDLVREYISDLRTVMGDDARSPRIIETVRGRGYRLCAPIALRTPQVPEHRVRPWRTLPSASGTRIRMRRRLASWSSSRRRPRSGSVCERGLRHSRRRTPGWPISAAPPRTRSRAPTSTRPRQSSPQPRNCSRPSGPSPRCASRRTSARRVLIHCC